MSTDQAVALEQVADPPHFPHGYFSGDLKVGYEGLALVHAAALIRAPWMQMPPWVHGRARKWWVRLSRARRWAWTRPILYRFLTRVVPVLLAVNTVTTLIGVLVNVFAPSPGPWWPSALGVGGVADVMALGFMGFAYTSPPQALWERYPDIRLAIPGDSWSAQEIAMGLGYPGSPEQSLISDAERQWTLERLQQAAEMDTISTSLYHELVQRIPQCRWVDDLYGVLLDAAYRVDDTQVSGANDELAQAFADGRLDPEQHRQKVEELAQLAVLGRTHDVERLCGDLDRVPTTAARDQLCRRLAAAYAAGYLTADEFNARMTHAQQAPTIQQMRTVLRGLPL